MIAAAAPSKRRTRAPDVQVRIPGRDRRGHRDAVVGRGAPVLEDEAGDTLPDPRALFPAPEPGQP